MIANVNLTDTFSTWFSKTNQVILFANQLNDTQNLEFTTINAAYTMANANYVVTNSAFGTVNAAWNMLNVAYITGNANYAVTNAAFNELNAAYTVINSAYTSSNANYVLTNSAFTVLNSAYTSSNANYVLTNSVYTQANTDNVRLSAAYVVLNSAYTVLNAAYTSSNADYVTTNAAFGLTNLTYNAVNSAFGVINASYTSSNANYVLTNSVYTQANTDNVRLSAAYVLTNSVYTQANTDNVRLSAAYVVVNSAYTVLNAAYTSSNSGFSLTNATYTAVNSAFGVINAAYTSSNAGYTVANAAFGYANASNSWANVTFVKLSPGSNTPALVQTISSDIQIKGNLIITGTTTQQGVQSLSIGSGTIIMYGNLASSLPPSGNAAIVVNRGLYANAQLLWNEPANAWMMSGNTTNLFYIASNTDVSNVGVYANNYANASFYTIANGTAAFNKANGAVQTAYVTHSVAGTSLTPTTNANTITITSSNNIVLIANATNSGIQITQAPSGVTATTYGGSTQIPTFTVDTYGRLTSAANVTVSIPQGANSFATIIASGNTFFANTINTSLTIGNSNGIVVTSNSLNNFINFAVQANSGIVANVNGVFLATGGVGASPWGGSGIASITTDAFGRVTAVTTATYLTSAVTSVTGTSGQIFVTNSTTNPVLNLVNSGVTAGSYTANDNFVSTFTVDQYGRITSASNVAVGNANYAIALTTAANTWANSTFVKLSAPGVTQTITGDLAITGNLTFTGNTNFLDSSTLVIGDSLIYLAANNYSGTDLIDIGIIANYGNATAQNVHSGLYRDHVSKEWFLFQGMDKEPGSNNVITPYANNMVNAVLNADLITSNLTLGGANAISWINAAISSANTAGIRANAAVQTAYVTHSVAGTSLTPATNNATLTITSSNNIILLPTAANGSIQITQNPVVGLNPVSYGGSSAIPTFGVDAYGRITSAANVTITAVNSLASQNSTVFNVSASTGAVTVGPTASGVTAGTYGSATVVPQITVDAYGRVTSLTTTTIGGGSIGTVTSVATGAGLTGGTITTSGTLSVVGSTNIISNTSGIFLATGGAGVGTYGTGGIATITLDAFGRVTGTTTATYVINGGALGTPSSGTLTNCTFPTLNQNTTGSASYLNNTYAYTNGVDGWWRSKGNAGWYSADWACGIYATAAGLVTTYNTSNGFYVNNTLYATGSIYANYSDERLKTKVGNIDNALQSVCSLNAFKYIDNDLAMSYGYKGTKVQVGLSAQEIQRVLPEVVSLAPFDMVADEETHEMVSKSGENYLTVDYSKIVPLLIESIKELNNKVDELQNEITQLKGN